MEKKCQKDWGSTIEEFGGFTINEFFPDDGRMLGFLRVALKHLEKQYPGVDFQFGTEQEILDGLRCASGFNRVCLARISPMQHKVSYTIKAMRNALQRLYFEETKEANPFSFGHGSGICDAEPLATLVQARKAVNALNSNRCNVDTLCTDESDSPEAELERKEFEAYLQKNYPIIWAIRRGYSRQDIRKWLRQAYGKLTNQELEKNILSEAGHLATVLGKDTTSVMAEIETLLNTTRGTRGSYKGGGQAAKAGTGGEMHVVIDKYRAA